MKKIKQVVQKLTRTPAVNATLNTQQSITFTGLLQIIVRNNQHIGDAILKNFENRSDLAAFRKTCKTANAIITSSIFWQKRPALEEIQLSIKNYQSHSENGSKEITQTMLASLSKVAKIFEVEENFSVLINNRAAIYAIFIFWNKLASNDCLTKDIIRNTLPLLLHSELNPNALKHITQRLEEIEKENQTDKAARKATMLQYLKGSGWIDTQQPLSLLC